MRRIFILLSVMFFISLGIWIFLYVTGAEKIIELSGKGYTDPVFSAAANKALTDAESVRNDIIAESRRWNFFNQVAGWITLAASSIVTLTAGILGESQSASTPPKRTARMYLLGGLGALASVGTLAGSYTKDIAQTA